MNNLFVDTIDIKNINRTNYIEKLLLKTIGFVFKEDKLLKSKNSTTMFLLFNTDTFIKSKNNIKVLKRVLKINLRVKRNLNIIFSKKINSLVVIKNELINVLNIIVQNNNYIESLNQLKQRDIKYIERYISTNKIDKNKFKLLVVLNDLIDLDVNKIKEYIEKYKFVDILKMKDVSKIQYKKMLNIIEEINKEYGASIDIIQKRNIQNYNFYILYSKGLKEFFKTHYILDNKAYVLDITDVDDDILSKEYKLYEKNKGYIKTLFDRMCLSNENFSKTDLGSLYS